MMSPACKEEKRHYGAKDDCTDDDSDENIEPDWISFMIINALACFEKNY